MTGVQTCALPICFPVTIGGEYWREVDGFYFTVRSSYGGTFPTEGPFSDFDTAEEEAALVIGEDRAAIACYEED